MTKKKNKKDEEETAPIKHRRRVIREQDYDQELLDYRKYGKDIPDPTMD